MKTRILILLTLTLMMQPLMAQVTGNVKRINIYGDTLIDNSGTKVVFQPTSGTAVADSTTTNNNGDYSISLAGGTYQAVITYPDHFQKTTGTILAPVYSVPPVTISEKLPQVIVPPGNISGYWPGYKHYLIESVGDQGFTIPANDTLIIGEGAIVTIASEEDLAGIQIDTVLRVLGHLLVEGKDTAITLFGHINQMGGGYEGFARSTMYIKADPGSSFLFEHTGLVLPNFSGTSSTFIFNNTVTPKLHSFYYIDNPLNNIIGSTILLDGEQNYISLTGSEFSGLFQLRYNSKMLSKCSYFDESGIYIYQSSSIELEGSAINNYSDLYCLDCDTIILTDNTLVNTGLSTTINSGLPAAYINVSNNLGYGFSINSIGPQNLTVLNNAFILGCHFDLDTEVNTLKFDYNLLVSPISNNFMSGTGIPNWLITSRNAPGTGPLYDTTDLHFNQYFRETWLDSIVNWNATPYAYPFGLKPFADTLFNNTGDLALTDPDGSRSDKGSRNIYGCSNSYLLFSSSSVTTIADSVFPGDTNHDGIANNDDLLPIGLKYLQTGPVRPGATTNWVGQDAPDWNDSLASNLNIKHVDCNGDGTISSPDVNAIYLNYGLTHNNPKQRFAEGLWYQFPTDSIFTGDTIEIGIMLGRSLVPVNNFYGIAFTMLYDSNFIKPSSAKMTFDPCWVGTDSVNMISLFREDTTILKYDAALVRTDGQNVSGFGQIGTLSVVMNDDIQAKDEMTLTTFMDFEDILAINFQEQALQVGGDGGTFNAFVGYNRTVSIKSIDAEMLQLFPNPAKDKLRLKNNLGTLVSYQLFNLNGSLLLSGSTQNMEHNIDISELNNGLYIVKLQTANAEQINKISIIK